MKIIQPSFTIEYPQSQEEGIKMLKRIEQASRTCYKSDDKITDTSYIPFIANILSRGHESVIEHEKVTMRITCDRGISHQLVRHRLASYSQESTRYCNYSDDKFGNEITVIDPSDAFGWDRLGPIYQLWYLAMINAENSYLNLIAQGAQPQAARSVLPTSLKTELVMTMNLRELRWFLASRTSAAAHPQMRQLTKPMLPELKTLIPIIFDNLGIAQ